MRLAGQTWGNPHDALRTVLLLHGVTGWSRTWWRVGPAVAAAGYQVLALDLHGHGNSPKPGRAVSIAEVERDVVETLDERFDTRRVDIIWGHSLGAMIALMLLGRNPELAERAVLVDPPLTPGSPADLEAVAALWQQQSGLARRQPEVLFQAVRDQNRHWHERDVADTVESMAALDVATLAATLAQGEPYDGFERLAALQMPTLVVLAAEDRGSPITGAVRQSLASLHSLVEVVELDSGHNLHRDAFDVYTQTVLQWLES
jgi:pimeloyl-ACP methyl ester carboxylesterase